MLLDVITKVSLFGDSLRNNGMCCVGLVNAYKQPLTLPVCCFRGSLEAWHLPSWTVYHAFKQEVILLILIGQSTWSNHQIITMLSLASIGRSQYRQLSTTRVLWSVLQGIPLKSQLTYSLAAAAYKLKRHMCRLQLKAAGFAAGMEAAYSC